MNISDQIDTLQKRAADLKSSFEQSRKETNGIAIGSLLTAVGERSVRSG